MKETKNLKIQARKFFKQHKSVVCPAFPKEKVIFRGIIVNAKGKLDED